MPDDRLAAIFLGRPGEALELAGRKTDFNNQRGPRIDGPEPGRGQYLELEALDLVLDEFDTHEEVVDAGGGYTYSPPRQNADI